VGVDRRLAERHLADSASKAQSQYTAADASVGLIRALGGEWKSE
jgi:hypothetical protein